MWARFDLVHNNEKSAADLGPVRSWAHRRKLVTFKLELRPRSTLSPAVALQSLKEGGRAKGGTIPYREFKQDAVPWAKPGILASTYVFRPSSWSPQHGRIIWVSACNLGAWDRFQQTAVGLGWKRVQHYQQGAAVRALSYCAR